MLDSFITPMPIFPIRNIDVMRMYLPRSEAKEISRRSRYVLLLPYPFLNDLDLLICKTIQLIHQLVNLLVGGLDLAL